MLRGAAAGQGHVKRAGLHPVTLASLSLIQGKGPGRSEPCLPGFAGYSGAAMGALGALQPSFLREAGAKSSSLALGKPLVPVGG